MKSRCEAGWRIWPRRGRWQSRSPLFGVCSSISTTTDGPMGFDEAAAVVFQRLRRARLRIGTMDVKIAAIVLSCEALLLSRNLADFRQVPGLQVEDWTVEQ